MRRGRGGIQFEDKLKGTGDVAKWGSRVELQYTMRLNQGEIVKESELLSFRLGERSVIPGIEYGVEGMRVGGRRFLRIGPHLGYGEKGVPGKVPPKAVLEVDAFLLTVTSAREL